MEKKCMKKPVELFGSVYDAKTFSCSKLKK